MKKVNFVPDFTATIRDDCTYLEISAQTYLLAYKSTLINKNRIDGQDNKDVMSELDGVAPVNALPLNKITIEGHLEEDTVVIRSNGSLKRRNLDAKLKRANSDISACLLNPDVDVEAHDTSRTHVR